MGWVFKCHIELLKPNKYWLNSYMLLSHKQITTWHDLYVNPSNFGKDHSAANSYSFSIPKGKKFKSKLKMEAQIMIIFYG